MLISFDRICLGLESYQDVHKVDSWLRCLLLSVGKWYHPNSRSTVATVSRKKKREERRIQESYLFWTAASRGAVKHAILRSLCVQRITSTRDRCWTTAADRCLTALLLLLLGTVLRATVLRATVIREYGQIFQIISGRFLWQTLSFWGEV